MNVSLKKRLVGILLALTLFSWLAGSLFTGLYSSKVILDQVDGQLEQYSHLVSYITQFFSRQADAEVPTLEPWLSESLENHVLRPIVVERSTGTTVAPAVNIWLGDSLLAVLQSSPRFGKPDMEGFSFRHLENDSGHWRVLTRFDESTGLWILVGIDIGAARRAVWGVLLHTLFPLLIVLPLTLLILYFGVIRGLAPLKALASQISQRNPRLLEPVQSDDVPSEMIPVVDALNVLLERLAYTLEGEQRFTANAAHELLTPLAAIKTEVQLCQRQLDDPRGTAMLERIALRVDRASHTVEQLMTLARLDPESPLASELIDLQQLVAEVISETESQANTRGLEVELLPGPAAKVLGNKEALAIMLRNLMTNAFRYASDSSVIGVRLADATKGPELTISNSCDPLSPEEFGRIGDRFYRAPGSVGMGAGLGLSIVARIAALHDASFRVGPQADGSGFAVSVSFAVPYMTA